MELSVRPAGRGGGKTAGVPAARTAAAAQGTKRAAGGDRLELSRAALSWVDTLNDRKLQEQERQEALRRKQADRPELLDQLDGTDKTADAQGESFRVMSRCMKIASNIMSGKKVPVKDVQYLMEHDARLYQLAAAMRRPKKDDKECDPVVRDEEERAASAGTAAAPQTAASEAAESSGAEAPSAPADGGAEAE